MDNGGRLGMDLLNTNRTENLPGAEAHMFRNYGLTPLQYNEMLLEQERRCACCGSSEPSSKSGRFLVDHCHESGKIRGLICGKCNLLLGLLGDDYERAKERFALILSYL